MVRYRKATKSDVKNIAALHAENWRLNYRGILDDHYLNYEVDTDRSNVWQNRFKKTRADMGVIVAEIGTEMVGFGCIFYNENEKYGAYLDNLHVAKAFGGQGIGKALMSLLANEVVIRNERQDMYLWVLKENEGAIRLYERLRGQRGELEWEKELWERPVEKIRFYWPDVKSLILDKTVLE